MKVLMVHSSREILEVNSMLINFIPDIERFITFTETKNIIGQDYIDFDVALIGLNLDTFYETSNIGFIEKLIEHNFKGQIYLMSGNHEYLDGMMEKNVFNGKVEFLKIPFKIGEIIKSNVPS